LWWLVVAVVLPTVDIPVAVAALVDLEQQVDLQYLQVQP
jgi:hypothetical protein